ncbi:hypothetical protein FDUTEX481_04863 [Tolypothrix sp. PCC 7601]|nr:hypothetical protein FDUTEX481_04863 [Tolypothrix sp. PCC 7601]
MQFHLYISYQHHCDFYPKIAYKGKCHIWDLKFKFKAFPFVD